MIKVLGQTIAVALTIVAFIEIALLMGMLPHRQMGVVVAVVSGLIVSFVLFLTSAAGKTQMRSGHKGLKRPRHIGMDSEN